MSTVPKRRAGRKPTIIVNPFIITDEWGDKDNVLWNTENELDIRIEDALIGCIRAFTAESKNNQEFVSWTKLLRVYRNVDQLNTQAIADYLLCTVRQSQRYMQVIKLANPFILRYMRGKSGSTINSYIEVASNQVKEGYLIDCISQKEGLNDLSEPMNLIEKDKPEWLVNIKQLLYAEQTTTDTK